MIHSKRNSYVTAASLCVFCSLITIIH
jgi:hypothetical protein